MKKLFLGIASCLLMGSCSVAPQNNDQAQTLAGQYEAEDEVADEEENDTDMTADMTNISRGAEKAIADMEGDKDEPQSFSGTNRIRIVSYNCENLYDTYDDPKTADDEFTPEGSKKWNTAKYKTKLINIAKAIKAAGNGTMPALVGLMEIENKTVLNDLCNQNVMKSAGYRYVHKDSPDARGIDVGLLYRTDLIKILNQKWLTVKLPNDGKTRDILYAKCELGNKEILHVLVNHWPSMREGEKETEPKREAAAKAARKLVDSLRRADGDINVVLMGDFNSKRSQTAMNSVLKVKSYDKNEGKGSLCDLISRYDGNNNVGTHKYSGHWDVIDHMIVDGGMLNQNNKVFTTPYSGHICHEKFLLTQSKSGYYSPKRSYKGDFWTSGYSDHLPISMDLYLK